MAITIDTLASPQLDRTLNTLVQLDTTVLGSSYSWLLIDRPNGSAATLSSSFLQNPTITPDVTGTYLISLVVDANPAVFALFSVQELRSRQRMPAAGEDDTSNGGALASSRGWATDAERALRWYSKFTNRGAYVVCKNNQGGVVNRGQLVYVSGQSLIASGLAEEDDVPEVKLAKSDASATLGIIGMVWGDIDENTSVADQELCLVAFTGQVYPVDTSAFAAQGNIYVDDATAGALKTTPGAIESFVGRVLVSGVTGSVFLHPSRFKLSDPTPKRTQLNFTVSTVLTKSQVQYHNNTVNTTAAAGVVTMTLPNMGAGDGGASVKFNRRGGTHAVDLTRSGTNTIAGNVTHTLAADYDSVTLEYDETEDVWFLQ